jgi:hypothetical protein
MKPKKFNKRIRRLEARLQKGAKKLAKLKQKLEARTQRKKRRPTPKAGMEPAGVKEPSVPKRAKRKLDLTPERRAQLAAAMKARWAAKRAAATANPPNSSADPGLTPGDLSRPR